MDSDRTPVSRTSSVWGDPVPICSGGTFLAVSVVGINGLSEKVSMPKLFTPRLVRGRHRLVGYVAVGLAAVVVRV